MLDHLSQHVLAVSVRLSVTVCRLQAGHADCPVCKTIINKKGDIIPLYGRSTRNSRHSSTASSSSIPPRPAPYPSSSSTPHSYFSSSATSSSSSSSSSSLPHVPPPFSSLFGPSFNFHSQHGTFSFSAGYGLFPAIFGLQFAAFQLQELLRGGSGSDGSGVSGERGGDRGEGGVVGGGSGGSGGGSGEVGSGDGDARLSRFLMFLGVFMLLLLLMY